MHEQVYSYLKVHVNTFVQESSRMVHLERRCDRCGKTWTPRQPGRPYTCPNCRSPRWDHGQPAGRMERLEELLTLILDAEQEAPNVFSEVEQIVNSYVQMKARSRGVISSEKAK